MSNNRQIADLGGANGLDASGGSALVGFLQSGTGAVARTGQAKMRETISVKDFGAVGDGVTNDTVAFNAAIDAVAAAGGGVVIVPPASAFYLVTSIILKGGVCLSSQIPSFAYGKSTPDMDMVKIKSVTAGWVIDTPNSPVNACGINGLTITGDGSGASVGGIRFRNVNWGFVKNCHFDDLADQAILHVQGAACAFNNVFAINCLLNRTRAAPIGVLEIQALATDDYVFQCEFTASQLAVSDANLYLAAVLVSGTNTFITDCVGEISDIGYRIEGDFNRISNCRADLNWGHGYYLANASGFASNNQFANCLALNNSRGTTNTYDGFNCQATAALNMFVNCQSVTSFGAAHRYGFNDLNAGDTTKNSYNMCFVGGAATKSFNFTNDGPIISFGGSSNKLLTVNSATPSVDQYTTFRTSNSSATTITNFSSGVSGQIINVFCTDSNTTIQHNGATIILPNTADMKLINGFTYTFNNNNGVWYFRSSAIKPSAFVADPTGGATVDSQSRTAIVAIIDSLIAAGVMLPS
jgi:hypothetical protein